MNKLALMGSLALNAGPDKFFGALFLDVLGASSFIV